MIQLTKDLWMTADNHCYIVGLLNKTRREAVQRGRKDSVLRNPKYYSTAAQAVRGALETAMRIAVKDDEITTLRQFIQEQERLRGELELLVAPLEGDEVTHEA